jgi:hypothetical protein
MSLHNAAQHLAEQGRGPDTRLIHMSDKEIAGLQALAMAHGGSLTINPKTGLPEAGFLDNLLPTIVGAGIGYFTGNPMMAAAIMGGGTYLNTGDLGKGLMAGLGGYGAGSLGASMGGFGEAAIGAGAAEAANAEAVKQGLTGEAQSKFVQDQVTNKMANIGTMEKLNAGMGAVGKSGVEALGGWKNVGMAAAPALMQALTPHKAAPVSAAADQGMVRPYEFAYNAKTPTNMVGADYKPGELVDSSERTWFDPKYKELTPYKAAGGGLMTLAAGGPVEQMSNANAVGANTGFPMADVHSGAYATPYQTPVSQNVLQGAQDTRVDPYTGEERFAAGGLSTLGGYAAGGNPRLLKGPGDGMSDNIPAVIGDKQPARLADGEFVVPADVVSHLGNGSTDAGAKQLYKMMDRIRAQRTGKKKQAPEVNPRKAMPA